MSSSSKSIAAQETPPTGVPATISRQRTQRRRSKDRRKRGLMIGANFSSALDALWANRLRSLLTTLGVVIGVAAVIAVVTLTQGATTLLNQQLANLGTNTLIIFPGVGGATTSLAPGDATALSKVPHITNVSPVLYVRGQAVFGNQNWSTSVEGVTLNFQSIQNWQLAKGSWYNADQ
ncbi:MAG: ABC transporter permease, partial [Chloroflexi bacterium]